MGRKREKPLQPGDKTTLYIPKSISNDALEWINSADYLSTELINLVENKVSTASKDSVEICEEKLRKIMKEELTKALDIGNKSENKTNNKKNNNKKKHVLRDLKL